MANFRIIPLLTYLTYYLVFTYNKRTIEWNGLEWSVRRSYTNKVQPGPTLWSGGNLWVDMNNHLHMSISKDADAEWRSSQICSVDKLGFGRYAYTLNANINAFDPTTVLGFYVIDSNGVQDNDNEIDIEIAKWSKDYYNRSNLWFIVRGDVSKYPRVYYEKLVNMKINTYITHHEFTWTNNNVSFLSKQGDDNLLASWDFIPKPEQASISIPQVPCRLCINYWNHQGNIPFDNMPSSIIINDIDYAGKNYSAPEIGKGTSGNFNLNVAPLVNEYLYPLVKDYVPIEIKVDASGCDLKEQFDDLMKALVSKNKLSLDGLTQADISNIDGRILDIVKENVMTMTENMKFYPLPSSFSIMTNENNGDTTISTSGGGGSTSNANQNKIRAGIPFFIWSMMIGLFMLNV